MTRLGIAIAVIVLVLGACKYPALGAEPCFSKTRAKAINPGQHVGYTIDRVSKRKCWTVTEARRVKAKRIKKSRIAKALPPLSGAEAKPAADAPPPVGERRPVVPGPQPAPVLQCEEHRDTWARDCGFHALVAWAEMTVKRRAIFRHELAPETPPAPPAPAVVMIASAAPYPVTPVQAFVMLLAACCGGAIGLVSRRRPLQLPKPARRRIPRDWEGVPL